MRQSPSESTAGPRARGCYPPPTIGARTLDPSDPAATGRLDEEVPLVPAPRDRPLPLSFEQERIWRFSRNPAAAAGWTTVVCERWSGPLDARALGQAVDYIVRRHEILRTVFVPVPGEVLPGQVANPPSPVGCPLVDLSGEADSRQRLEELVRSEAGSPFDLERGPLLRLRLVKVGPDEHVLVRITQHIISDARSWEVFQGELRELYDDFRRGRAPSLPDTLPLQYADYAAWQRLELAPGRSRPRQDAEWWRSILDRPDRPGPVPRWRRALARARILPLPSPQAPPSMLLALLGWDGPPGDVKPSDGVLRVRLPPEPVARFDAAVRKAPASLFMGVLAAFAAHVALDGGRRRLDLGSYVTTRGRAELEGLMGLFSGLVPFRLELDAGATFRSWLARVRDVVLDTLEHASLPYETLCDRLGGEGFAPPEIEAIVLVSRFPDAARLGDVEVTLTAVRIDGWPWGFSWDLVQGRGEFWLRATFDPRTYDPGKVRRFVDRHAAFLDAAASAPDRPLADVFRDSAGSALAASPRP